MCGIVGFSNFNLGEEKSLKTLIKMNNKISHRGENDEGVYFAKDTFLAHKRLSIIDIDGGHQPMSFLFNGKKYVIVYNGEIYNTKSLKKKLSKNGISLSTNCDTEIVLKMYALYKNKCVKFLNGIFAFCIFDESEGSIFLARDQIGVKPLFYYINKSRLAFASEIKSLFKMKEIRPIVNKNGLRELFGIAPARTPGKTVYKDILELKPAEWLMFKDGKVTKRTYYKLKSKPHIDDEKLTAKKIREKFTKIVKNQLVSDVNLGMFLSGGLDSSIITAISSNVIKDRLKTFSVDYEGNEKNFVPTKFTPSRDNYYINLMAKKFNISHKYQVLNSKDLFYSLKKTLIARDVPAMADIDSSLFLFCRKVKQDVTVCLSGEFADEIFCGYPWFYLKEAVFSSTFPWAIDVKLRENTINKNLRKKLNLQNFIEKNYKNALKSVPICNFDTNEDKNMKIFSFLTMKYFGLNLLERTDRMSMQNGLEVRVPFTDYKFVEYVYNIPWSIKNSGGFEKGILRKAFEGVVPNEILFRKKSPYPKSNDPVYTSLVETEIKNLLLDSENKIWQILDIENVKEVLNSEETGYPWFGQLMNKTQYLAFILQTDMWIKEYKVVFNL